MKMNITITHALDLVDLERENQITRKETTDFRNANDAILKMDKLTQILCAFDENLVLENIEGCHGDGKIRNFDFFNTGSVVEALVRHCYGKRACKTDGGTDCGRYEVKTSLTCKSLCTAVNHRKCTIVVNGLGCWKCYAKDLDKYLNNQRKFPHNKPCGIYLPELSLQMGFELWDK